MSADDTNDAKRRRPITYYSCSRLFFFTFCVATVDEKGQACFFFLDEMEFITIKNFELFFFKSFSF